MFVILNSVEAHTSGLEDTSYQNLHTCATLIRVLLCIKEKTLINNSTGRFEISIIVCGTPQVFTQWLSMEDWMNSLFSQLLKVRDSLVLLLLDSENVLVNFLQFEVWNLHHCVWYTSSVHSMAVNGGLNEFTLFTTFKGESFPCFVIYWIQERDLWLVSVV